MLKFYQKWVLYFLIVFLGGACKSKQNVQHTETILKVIQPKYAKGFRIEVFKNYKILSVLQPYTDKRDTLRFVLAKNKKLIPSQLQKIPFIKTPIQKIICTSTTHLALLEALGGLDALVGASSLEYVYSSAIRKKVEKGQIVSLSDQQIEVEKIIALQPDLLMVSGMEASQMSVYKKIEETDIAVFINSEWLENHPLGKAEWIKVMAVLLDKEQEAEAFFENISSKYLAIKAETEKIKNKKSVAIGVPNKETWYVSAGESFGATFLKDAGAFYAFADEKGTGSLPLNKEIVLQKFKNADVWLNVDVNSFEVKKVLCDLKFVNAVKNQKIYDRNKRIAVKGGNDFWESGVVHPEIILEDLVKILYPKLLPESEKLYFYQKLEQICE
ncbi:MAG: ABC transporter substrate-binding protein [Thermonemataceae bacterium]|nr:ABC transporter substrate-binding protein [Thermonemataceae bacterium]